jgi:predicted dehydrogenase
MDSELRRRFGRRLRLGMVGGGQASLIGETHRMAARLDDRYELVAGSFSSDPTRGRAAGSDLLIPMDRVYADFRRMAEAESNRADGIDVVTICSPTDSHHAVAVEFLRRGVDVICDKPMTSTLQEAADLVKAVRKSGRLFCLTHNYTGYPMVREARARIAAGDIGAVRLVIVEFPIGTSRMVVEEPDSAKRHWRFDPARVGVAGILGEVGTHVHHMASYVSGLDVAAVSATMSIFTPGRRVYDNAFLTVKFGNGAQGTFWSSYVAAGNEHGLSFRVHGEKGGFAWRQEEPNELWLMPFDGPHQRLARAQDGLSPAAERATRIRIGHPEAFTEAFANLYRDFAVAAMAARLGNMPDPSTLDFPCVEDGARTLKLIEAATVSNERNGAWVDASLNLTDAS